MDESAAMANLWVARSVPLLCLGFGCFFFERGGGRGGGGGGREGGGSR